jgi:hypothetical protein
MGATSNAYLLAADFGQAAESIRSRARDVVKHHAMLMQVRIQANASGRPGPRVITGDYRRSWNTTHLGMSSVVSTNKPQARRLEWGFYGPDSLGRVYHQPPFPHVGPAFDAGRPGFEAAMLSLADDL